MTQLKFTLAIDDYCTLKLQDTTGFFSASATGFIPEATSTIPTDSYKITNGYFMNVILYNKYASDPIIVNKQEIFYNKTVVDPTYINNFPIESYKLAQDGVYSIKRIFIISNTFYESQKLTSRFNGKTVYYTDGVTVYKVVSGVGVESSVTEFINDTDPVVGMITTTKIVSTCYLNQCYFNIVTSLLSNGCTACTDKDSELIKSRDFIFMILEAIKYYKEDQNTVEIQKLIETTTMCGGLCKQVSMTSDCGCNG